MQVPRGAEPMAEQPPEAEPPILLLSGVGAVAIGTVAGIGAIFAYNATENSFATINTGEDTSAEKRAEYRAYYATCGALTAVSVAAVVGGVGLIVFSVME